VFANGSQGSTGEWKGPRHQFYDSPETQRKKAGSGCLLFGQPIDHPGPAGNGRPRAPRNAIFGEACSRWGWGDGYRHRNLERHRFVKDARRIRPPHQADLEERIGGIGFWRRDPLRPGRCVRGLSTSAVSGRGVEQGIRDGQQSNTKGGTVVGTQCRFGGRRKGPDRFEPGHWGKNIDGRDGGSSQVDLVSRRVGTTKVGFLLAGPYFEATGRSERIHGSRDPIMTGRLPAIN